MQNYLHKRTWDGSRIVDDDGLYNPTQNELLKPEEEVDAD